MNTAALELALMRISNIAYNMSQPSTLKQFDPALEFKRIQDMAETALKELKKNGL